MSGDTDTQEAVTFERALAQLDEVVERLESGGVGLEEAVALFERGQGYLEVCRTRLEAAQKRIDELTAEDMPALPGETGEESPL